MYDLQYLRLTLDLEDNSCLTENSFLLNTANSVNIVDCITKTQVIRSDREK